MSLDIEIDRELCMGSGQCSLYAPGTFGQDGLTVAIVVNPDGDPDSAIMLARDSCPTGAISVTPRQTEEPGASA
jgi:ferredoxin